MLLRFLPADESAFIQAAYPDEAAAARWSFTTEAVASLYELTATGRGYEKYPRPADMAAQRAHQKRIQDALEAQRARNRERDEAERGGLRG